MQALGLKVMLPQFLGFAVVFLLLVGLSGKGFDDMHADQILLQNGHGFPHDLLHIQPHGAEFPQHQGRLQDRARREGETEQGQFPV